MTYLALKKEVKNLQQQASQTIHVSVVSDMPLQPWFDLYLQKAFAQKGKNAQVCRIAWESRREAPKDTQSDIRILWPSREAAREVDPLQDTAGVWISPEYASDPLQPFFGAVQMQEDEGGFAVPGHVLNLERIMLRLGLEACMAGPRDRRFGDVYSPALQELVAQEAVRLYEALHGRRKKCLVLDCDGVLWGGIASEDGLEGIVLSETGRGQRYACFQRLAAGLSRCGVLLAICSKNDEETVRSVFRRHTAMVLREKDIAAWSVNWQPKSQQLADLSRVLGIDLQDMVLLDDQQWELAEVQSRYPQVEGVWFESGDAIHQLAEHFCLLPEDCSGQNQLRLQTYQDNVRRESLRRQCESDDAFLERLGTRVSVQKAGPSDLARISDLSRRANRCTNGTRYTAEQLQERLAEGYELQAVFVSDIFRDLGLVGCLGIDRTRAELDLFCLSCRALGRKLEQQLLAALPPEIVRLRWTDTGKNAWLKTLLEEGRSWET